MIFKRGNNIFKFIPYASLASVINTALLSVKNDVMN